MKAKARQTELTYQYNKAYDLVTEAQSRMMFLLESAPMNYTDQNFSREGLSGLGWTIGDIADKLKTAQNMMKKLVKEVGHA